MYSIPKNRKVANFSWLCHYVWYYGLVLVLGIHVAGSEKKEEMLLTFPKRTFQ